MSCWFVIGYRSNITLVRCKYIYNYVNIELLFYFFVFYDSRLRVFQFVSTDADIRTDRRRHPHRPTQTSAPTDADIRTDRRGCSYRPTQMLVSTDADARIDRRR